MPSPEFWWNFTALSMIVQCCFLSQAYSKRKSLSCWGERSWARKRTNLKLVLYQIQYNWIKKLFSEYSIHFPLTIRQSKHFLLFLLSLHKPNQWLPHAKYPKPHLCFTDLSTFCYLFPQREFQSLITTSSKPQHIWMPVHCSSSINVLYHHLCSRFSSASVTMYD